MALAGIVVGVGVATAGGDGVVVVVEVCGRGVIVDGSRSSLGTEKTFSQVFKRFEHMYILDEGFAPHSTHSFSLPHSF
jgi:hypothetical protein